MFFQILQGCYLLVAFINDFYGTNEPFPREYPVIRRVKDFIFAALAFPTAAYVSVIFWSVYAFNRDMILPAKYFEIFPWWLNQIVHTNVLVWMIVEHFFTRYQSQNTKLEVASLALWSLSYLTWVFVIKHFAGVWIYPFMNVLSVYEMIFFFTFAQILPFVCYFSGKLINQLVWNAKSDHQKVK